MDDALAADKRLVLGYIEEVINKGHLDRLDSFIAAEYRGHGFQTHREALRSFLEWQKRTAPDWRINVEDVVAEGDRVVVRATASGTRSEEAPGQPYPTPLQRRVEWITIYRVQSSEIAEAWVVTRNLDR